MIVLKFLYLFISFVCFVWTLIVSLGIGLWLYVLYLFFGIGVAVMGILFRVKRKKRLKTIFYLCATVPVAAGLVLVLISIIPMIFIYFSTLFHLIFSR
ncbi:MAG: hypothetical protein ACOX3X_02435 [Eubacteriales bacterium]|jgi:hypothetical protein